MSQKQYLHIHQVPQRLETELILFEILQNIEALLTLLYIIYFYKIKAVIVVPFLVSASFLTPCVCK